MRSCGKSRQTWRGKLSPEQPRSGSSWEFSRQTASGSLHLAVSTRAGLARHTSTDRLSFALYPKPFLVEDGSWFWTGGASLPGMAPPGPGRRVFYGILWQL